MLNIQDNNITYMQLQMHVSKRSSVLEAVMVMEGVGLLVRFHSFKSDPCQIPGFPPLQSCSVPTFNARILQIYVSSLENNIYLLIKRLFCTKFFSVLQGLFDKVSVDFFATTIQQKWLKISRAETSNETWRTGCKIFLLSSLG